MLNFAATANLISTFVFSPRILQSLFCLNLKFQAYSHRLWQHKPVCVRPGWKSQRPVFWRRDSIIMSNDKLYQCRPRVYKPSCNWKTLGYTNRCTNYIHHQREPSHQAEGPCHRQYSLSLDNSLTRQNISRKDVHEINTPTYLFCISENWSVEQN